MSILVVLFGGADPDFIEEFKLENLLQQGGEYGRIKNTVTDSTEPDEIIATFLTGVSPNIHRIRGSEHFNHEFIDSIEQRLPNQLISVREFLYRWASEHIDRFNCMRRRYIAKEIQKETIFDKVEKSKPLFVPSYNPELQWCIYRNTIRAEEYPDLGLDGAHRLIDKNHSWRRQNLDNMFDQEECELLMIHFQYLDSIQHLYHERRQDHDKIREEYEMIDTYAGELKKEAMRNGFDTILFLSEHGRPNNDDSSEIHRRDGFYSCNENIGLTSPTHIDLHNEIIKKMTD